MSEDELFPWDDVEDEEDEYWESASRKSFIKSRLFSSNELKLRNMKRLAMSACCLKETWDLYYKNIDPLGTRKQLNRMLYRDDADSEKTKEDYNDEEKEKDDTITESDIDYIVQKRLKGLQKKFELFGQALLLLKQAPDPPFLRLAKPSILDETDGRKHVLSITRSTKPDIPSTDHRPSTISALTKVSVISHKNFLHYDKIKMIDFTDQEDTDESKPTDKPAPTGTNIPNAGQDEEQENESEEKDTDNEVSNSRKTNEEWKIWEPQAAQEAFEFTDIPLDEDGNPIGKRTGACHYCGKALKPFPTPYETHLCSNSNLLYCCEKYRLFIQEVMELERSLQAEKEKKHQFIDITPHEKYLGGQYIKSKAYMRGRSAYSKRFTQNTYGEYRMSAKELNSVDETHRVRGKASRSKSGSLSKSSKGKFQEGGENMTDDVKKGKKNKNQVTDDTDSLNSINKKERKKKEETKDVSSRNNMTSKKSLTMDSKKQEKKREETPGNTNEEDDQDSISSSTSHVSKGKKERKEELKQAEAARKEHNNARAEIARSSFRRTSSVMNRHKSQVKGPPVDASTGTEDLPWDPYETFFKHRRYFNPDVMDEAELHCFNHPLIVMRQTELYEKQMRTARRSSRMSRQSMGAFSSFQDFPASKKSTISPKPKNVKRYSPHELAIEPYSKTYTFQLKKTEILPDEDLSLNTTYLSHLGYSTQTSDDNDVDGNETVHQSSEEATQTHGIEVVDENEKEHEPSEDVTQIDDNDVVDENETVHQSSEDVTQTDGNDVVDENETVHPPSENVTHIDDYDVVNENETTLVDIAKTSDDIDEAD